MKKTLLFWLFFVLSIILAIYFATRIITSYMGRGPISYVKRVEITGNSHGFDAESVRMAIGITPGTKIRSIDLHQINNRVLSVPWVKNAATRRLPNGDIIIKTQQYKAVAMWSDGLMFYPLSADGTKIETPFDRPDKNTIVFRGELPDDLTDIINSVSVLTEYIDYMTWVESRRWNIQTRNGILIYLPEDNLGAAINKITTLNQTHKLLSRDLKIIDMRDDKRILIKQ